LGCSPRQAQTWVLAEEDAERATLVIVREGNSSYEENVTGTAYFAATVMSSSGPLTLKNVIVLGNRASQPSFSCGSSKEESLSSRAVAV